MMKNLNIGIAVIAISLMLASCGNSSEAERNQSAAYTSTVSSEQSASSEWIGSDCPVLSAITEKDVTSKAVAKTESSSISSRSDIASRASSKLHASSQASVSSSSTTSKIATVRAKELTIKFSHYRPDDRSSGSIYNDFKYGECMDYSAIIPKDEWGDYENLDSEGKSYGPGGSENICLTGTSGGTKEMAANNVYQMFKGSSAHWSDITKAEYTGVGIGIVIKYDKDRFDNIYCCILTMDRTYG